MSVPKEERAKQVVRITREGVEKEDVMATSVVYRHFMSEDDNSERRQAYRECQEGICVGTERLTIRKMRSRTHLELGIIHEPSSQ